MLSLLSSIYFIAKILKKSILGNNYAFLLLYFVKNDKTHSFISAKIRTQRSKPIFQHLTSETERLILQ